LRRYLFVPIAAMLAGCGRSATGPGSIPAAPTNVVVFYDENGNGVRDAHEAVQLPNALVRDGSSSARTGASGRAVLTAPAGSASLSIDLSSLPPFFLAAPLAAHLPAAGDVLLPVTLPIGANHPNTYMGVGDSITSNSGYLDDLQAQLRAYFGAARTINEGQYGTRSQDGAYRIYGILAEHRPAYTLILYGTNDWNERLCQSRFPCYTIDSLRYMLTAVKANGSLPVLATLMPVNTGYSAEAPPERNEWIARMNALIRALAPEQGAVLVDLNQAFLAQPDLKPLFSDYVHPSAAGRALIAQTFFDALTKRRAGS
jgi:lysophospholipase L1-like esterase